MDDPLLAGTPPRASSRENQLIMTDITLARAESPQEMRRDRSFGTLEAMAKPMPSTMPCSPSGNFGGWDESPAPSVPSSPRATRWNNQSLFRKYESPPRHTVPASSSMMLASPTPMMALAEAARRRALSTDTESSQTACGEVTLPDAPFPCSPPKRQRFASWGAPEAMPVSPSPPAAPPPPHSNLVALLWR